MDIRKAIEALRIEGGIEVTGNLRRVTEFFKGLDIAVSVLEEMQRCKERQVAIRVAERERKGKSGAEGLELILCEIKEALLEAYLDVANNYSVSDLHSDRDKVSVVAARTRSKIDERIEAIIMAHMDDTDWKAEAQKQCSAAGELRIRLGERLEEIRTRISAMRQMLCMEDNTMDQMILTWKISKMEEQAAWLESVLYGKRSGAGQAADEVGQAPEGKEP